MPTLITNSDILIEFDTLPAIKTVHYSSGFEPIYSYLRLYCHNNCLFAGAKIFSKSPVSGDCLAVCVASEGGDRQVVFEMSASGDKRLWYGSCAKYVTGTAPKHCDISGDDNQGYFWGAEIIFSDLLLSENLGIDMSDKTFFLANFMIYNKNTVGFGAAYNTKAAPFCTGYGDFLVVPY